MGSGSSKPSAAASKVETAPVIETPPPVSTPAENSSTAESSGCPMKKSDGSYSYDWGALFRRDFPHGPTGKTPLPEHQPPAATTDDAASSSSGCPVKHSSSDGCPVKKGQEYNVYSQPIDPKNNMPKTANQLPAPGQTKPLSTHRVASTIPKGGTENESTTWTYPSPQMFYNALARKGKLANAAETEEDEQDMMETVVSLHNDMNEKSWKKVLQWEDVTSPQEKSARLLKFQGRPSDLSPKAMFKHYVLGHPLPFDRHDWTVVRHDGSTVRYVLDYYYDDSPTEQETGKSSLLVDVRPALDSVSCMWHRFATMPAARHIANSTPFEPLPLRPTSAMKSQVPESLQVWKNIQADVARSRGQQQQQQQQQVDGSNKEEPPELTVTLAKARELKTVFDDTTPSACEKVRRALDACDSEEDCARASMAFTVCMAQFACPLQHQALITALQKDDDSAVDPALERVSDCVALQSQLHAAAKQQYPEVFQK